MYFSRNNATYEKYSTTLTSEKKKKPAKIVGPNKKILQLCLPIPCHGSKMESLTPHPPFGLQWCEIQQSFLKDSKKIISFCDQTKSYKVMIQNKFSMSRLASAETRFHRLGLFAIQ